MPPLPVITGTYRCALNWGEGTGRSAVNVMHLFADTAETAEDVFNGLEDAVTGDMWDAVHNAWSVQSVSVTPLDGSSATQEFATNTDGRWQGSGTGDTVVALACLVKLTTGLRGRSKRGRLYLPSIAESKTANGLIDASSVATMQAAWNTFFTTGITGFSKALVVASYVLAEEFNVSSILVELAGATQRRRQDRVRA